MVCVWGDGGGGHRGEVQVGMELWVSTLFLCHVILFSFLHIVLLIHMHILFYYFFGMLFAVTLYITFLNVLPFKKNHLKVTMLDNVIVNHSEFVLIEYSAK